MSRYAKNTVVGSEKTRGEIERTLVKYGATGFMYMWKGDTAVIAFEFGMYHVRLDVPMPPKSDFEKTPTGRKRKNSEDTLKAWEQATRQRWRAVLLIIKAKLEAVECGIRTFEQEFMGDFVLATGQTLSETMLPRVADAIKKGEMPQLLLPGQVG